MSLLRALRRPPRLHAYYSIQRAYAATAQASKTAEVKKEGAAASTEEQPAVATSLSACQANTVLTGVTYLKDQSPVVALPDDQYPEWLWRLLDNKPLPYDGPGGIAEKKRMRKENRKRIRDSNFMKTQ